MTEEAVRRLFDGLAEGYESRYPGPAEEIQVFASLLPPGGRVLDAGCGPGVSVAYLAALGFRAEGIDLSPGMVRRARALHPGLRFEVGDLRRLPVEPGSLSGILASFSIIFLPLSEVVGTLRHFHDCLVSGGLLHIVVQEGREDLRGSPLILSHARLLALLDEAGYRVEHDHVRDPRPLEMQTRKRSIIARRG